MLIIFYNSFLYLQIYMPSHILVWSRIAVSGNLKVQYDSLREDTLLEKIVVKYKQGKL